MSNPLISVIVPIYNVEQYLHECIDSIISQTYNNLEIILVDDGSPDRCPQICDEYKQKDNRICVIHKNNGGQSDARNKGLEVATGKFISFIDGDDVITKDFVETLYEPLLLKNEISISVCAIKPFQRNKSDISTKRHPVKRIPLERLISQNSSMNTL